MGSGPVQPKNWPTGATEVINVSVRLPLGPLASYLCFSHATLCRGFRLILEGEAMGLELPKHRSYLGPLLYS